MLDAALDRAEARRVTSCCWMGLVWVGVTLPEAAQKPPWPLGGDEVTPMEGGRGSEDLRGAGGTRQLLLVHQSQPRPSLCLHFRGCLHACCPRSWGRCCPSHRDPKTQFCPNLQDRVPPRHSPDLSCKDPLRPSSTQTLTRCASERTPSAAMSAAPQTHTLTGTLAPWRPVAVTGEPRAAFLPAQSSTRAAESAALLGETPFAQI